VASALRLRLFHYMAAQLVSVQLYSRFTCRVEFAGRCHVIELHKIRLFIYIPICLDQIWTFNLVYIYAMCYFAI
jgi:hypothetical protein